MRHFRSTAIALSVAFAGPVVLVHVLWLLRFFAQPSLAPAAEAHYVSPLGEDIRYFHRPSPHARYRVVFVHGSPADAHSFREPLHRGLPGCDLIAVDRPGFGGSRAHAPRYDLAYVAETLRPLFALTPALPTLVGGHSYGGPVALRAAIDDPEHVRGALLVGASVAPELEHPWHLQLWLARPWVGALFPPSLGVSNRELLALGDELRRLESDLPHLRVPVVMVHGTLDAQVPVENVAWLEGRLHALGRADRFGKRVLPDLNHYLPWENPEEIAAGLVALEKLL